MQYEYYMIDGKYVCRRPFICFVYCFVCVMEWDYILSFCRMISALQFYNLRAHILTTALHIAVSRRHDYHIIKQVR